MKLVLMLTVICSIFHSSIAQTSAQKFEEGEAQLKARDYNAAIQKFSEAIESFKTQNEGHPLFKVAYYKRGQANFHLGTYKAAIEDYTAAIVMDAQYAEAYSARATAKYNLEDFPGVIEDVNKALEIAPYETSKDEYGVPFYSQLFKGRGVAYYFLKDYTAAISDFDQALTLDPEADKIFLYRGYCKINLDQNAAGCADLRKASVLGSSEAATAEKDLCK